MNTKELHQQTIRGLIQTTVNRTLVDLERRGLIQDVSTERRIIDWTNPLSLTKEIDLLYTHGITSRRENTTIQNLITDIRTRATATYTGLYHIHEFEASLAEGIRAYSRHIKNNQYTASPNFAGFTQTIEEQTKWGILALYQIDLDINYRVSRYR